MVDRQERLLMRQRGAGTRQIKELDFQLVLPGISGPSRSPLKPQRSGRPRKTPQVKLPPRRSSRRTPQPVQSKPQSSSRLTSTTAKRKKAGKTPKSDLVINQDHGTVLHSLSTQVDEEGVTTKKRKSNSLENLSSNFGMLNVSEARQNRIDEEQDEGLQPKNTQNPVGVLRERKRRKRKPIGQMSRKKPRAERHIATQNIDMPAGVGQLESMNVDSEPYAPPLGTNVVEEQWTSEMPSSISEPQKLDQDPAQPCGKTDGRDLALTSPKPQAHTKPKRKKRKPIGQTQRHKKKVIQPMKPETLTQTSDLIDDGLESDVLHVNPGDLNLATTIINPRRRGRPKKTQLIKSPDNSEDNTLENMENNNGQRNATQLQRRGRPRKPLTIIREESQAEENHVLATEDFEMQAQLQNRDSGRLKSHEQITASPSSETHTTVQKGKRKYRATIKVKDSDAHQPSKITIPITVYRLSPAHADDRIDANADPISDPRSSFKDRGVNAVDALSQIRREMISKASNSVDHAAKHESSKPQKVEVERKREVIKMYGEELDNRLFQLTETLDNNTTLSARVRNITKEEKTLKAELKALQHQREETSKRRAEMESARQHAETSRTLHTLLSSIEAAVQAGKQSDLDNPPPTAELDKDGRGNLEFMLRRMAGDVSSNGEGMGLLERVKDFNGMLERAVAAL